MAVDLDEGAEAIESFTGGEILAVSCEADSIVEPHEGMEFESEDAAKIFYDEYARRVGFVMRVMSCRRSERDGRILARRLGCNKEGYCVSIRGKFGPVRKPRPSTREGCKAMIHIKFNKSGKWVITRFVKEHNHPLVVAPREARQTMVSSSFFFPPFPLILNYYLLYGFHTMLATTVKNFCEIFNVKFPYCLFDFHVLKA